MENVKATLDFKLIDAEGKELHATKMVWENCDQQQVVFLEKHLLGGLVSLNDQAASFIAGAT